MAKWTTSTALKAINTARADIAKRKEEDGENFTYEPWAVPDAETQANQAEEINRRYAELQQNGPSDAILAARQSVADSNAAYKNMVEENQRQREQEQAMLQNPLTVGSLDSYKAYKNASADQQTALANIYTAQNTKPTGYERFTGTAANAKKLANQFKTDYGVSDDDYNTLMEGYKAYRSGQAANALNSYGNISDEQKKALQKIHDLKTDTVTDSTDVGSFASNIWNSVTGKTQKNKAEASNLKEEFKQKYGVDDTTYTAWQAKYDEDRTNDEEKEAAQKEGKRTQSQELEYANNVFLSKANSSSSDALKQAIYDYIDQEDATQTSEAMQYAESASNANDDYSALQKQKLQLAQAKASIQSQYGLSDDDFENLKYYGQELYDAENRKKQQQEAYDNVHTGSTVKNIAGGIKNSAAALTTYMYGGVGGI